MAGGGEMGSATEQELEAQMQAGSPGPPSSSTPGLAQPAPTHDVRTPTQHQHGSNPSWSIEVDQD